MSKIEGLDPQGIAAWVHGLDRPTLAQSVAEPDEDSTSRVEEITESSEDTSDLSKSGHAFARASDKLKSVGYRHREGEAKQRDVDKELEDSESTRAQDEKGDSSEGLTADEEKQVRELKDTDTRVRAHEMAHKAAAGSLAAGGPYYDLQQGPDGQNYAVGGEVPIRLPETTDYKEAIKDAQQAERAALAPADPSPDDYAAAAAFRQRALEARAKLSDEVRNQKPAEGTKIGPDMPTEPAAGSTGPIQTQPSPQNARESERHSSDSVPEKPTLQAVASSFVTSSKAGSDSPV